MGRGTWDVLRNTWDVGRKRRDECDTCYVLRGTQDRREEKNVIRATWDVLRNTWDVGRKTEEKSGKRRPERSSEVRAGFDEAALSARRSSRRRVPVSSRQALLKINMNFNWNFREIQLRLITNNHSP